MAARPHAVVDFPGADESPATHALIEVLRRALGKISGLVDICLFSSPAGTVVPAGGTSTVVGASANLNTADVALNEVRLVVDAFTSVGTLTLDLYDDGAATSRCTVTVTTAPGSFLGEWAKIPLQNSDAKFVLRVLGNGAASLTLYSAHAQFRTSAFQH